MSSYAKASEDVNGGVVIVGMIGVPENWNAWAAQMFMYWQMPVVQNWQKSRRLTFSPEFRRFIEESPKSAMPLTIDFFAHGG